MFPRRLRWVPVVVAIGLVAGGLMLMALYRPLALGIGVFVCGLALLSPATRWARRIGAASTSPAGE